jgi:hypothetical protein
VRLDLGRERGVRIRHQKVTEFTLKRAVRVAGPRGTLVRQRARCGSMRDDTAERGPEGTSEDGFGIPDTEGD